MNDISNNHERDQKLSRSAIVEYLQKFDKFLTQWEAHNMKTALALNQLETLNSAAKTAIPYLENFKQLPVIASALTALQTSVMQQNSDLVQPATTSEKMPTKVTLYMLGICFIVILILGSALIVVLLRDTKKEFSLGGKDGLHITNSGSGNSKDSKNNADAADSISDQ